MSMSWTHVSLLLQPLSHTFQAECTENVTEAAALLWGIKHFAMSESL